MVCVLQNAWRTEDRRALVSLLHPNGGSMLFWATHTKKIRSHAAMSSRKLHRGRRFNSVLRCYMYSLLICTERRRGPSHWTPKKEKPALIHPCIKLSHVHGVLGKCIFTELCKSFKYKCVTLPISKHCILEYHPSLLRRGLKYRESVKLSRADTRSLKFFFLDLPNFTLAIVRPVVCLEMTSWFRSLS